MFDTVALLLSEASWIAQIVEIQMRMIKQWWANTDSNPTKCTQFAADARAGTSSKQTSLNIRQKISRLMDHFSCVHFYVLFIVTSHTA
jgi:hypothetical protein